MAIAFDANLGSTDSGSVAATLALTTTAAAASASRIIVAVSYFHSGAAAVSGISDGTAYTQDKKVTNGSDLFEIWSRHASGGLASGSTITVTFSAGPVGGAILIGAASFTGIATTAAVVSTGSATGTGANWSSGAATNTGQANALYFGGSGDEDPTAATTSTATSGTEIHDRYRTADQQGLVTGYKIVSTVASDAITGTFSNANSTANTGALVIYAAAAGAAAPTHFLATLGAGG